MMRSLTPILLASLALLPACGDVEDPALDETLDVGPEYVGHAPDGTLSPAFATEAELEEYLEAHPGEFPEGTQVLRR